MNIRGKWREGCRRRDMPAVSMSMSIYCQPSATHAAPGSKEEGAKSWCSASSVLFSAGRCRYVQSPLHRENYTRKPKMCFKCRFFFPIHIQNPHANGNFSQCRWDLETWPICAFPLFTLASFYLVRLAIYLETLCLCLPL